MSTEDSFNAYDLEPVRFCARCYSLKIKYEEAINTDCCMECGSSDTMTASIEEWEKLYERRYGHKFVTKGNDPKKSPIFKLPMSKLKEKVFESPSWKTIIKTLYPRFPRKLDKAESVILLFDKLVRDNRMDDLKLLLMKLLK